MTNRLLKKSLRIQFLIFITIMSITTFSQGTERTVTLVAQNISGKQADPLRFQESVIKAAFKESSIAVEIKYRPWARALQEVEEGLHDGAYTAWYNAERAKKYEFSEPYQYVDISLYKSKTSPIKYTGDLKLLKDYRIGIPKGWTVNEEFDTASYLNKKYTTNPDQLLQMLMKDRIDLVALNGQVVQTISKAYPQLKNGIVKLSPVLKRNTEHIIFSRAKPDFKDMKNAFDKGLKAIVSNGKLLEIEKEFMYTTGLLE